MRYDKKTGKYDLHAMLEQEEKDMVDELVLAMSGRPQTKKVTRWLKGVIHKEYEQLRSTATSPQ